MAGIIINLTENQDNKPSGWANVDNGKPLTNKEFSDQLAEWGITPEMFFADYHSYDSAQRNNILADAHVHPIIF